MRARKSGCLWAPVVRSTGMISKSRPFSLSTVATRTTLGDSGIPYSFSGAISSCWLPSFAAACFFLLTQVGRSVSLTHASTLQLALPFFIAVDEEDGWGDGRGQRPAPITRDRGTPYFLIAPPPPSTALIKWRKFLFSPRKWRQGFSFFFLFLNSMNDYDLLLAGVHGTFSI